MRQFAIVRLPNQPWTDELFQSDFFALPIERGLIDSQNLSRFGEVGGSFENLTNMRSRLQWAGPISGHSGGTCPFYRFR